MLTKESSRGFNEMFSYPTYKYVSKRGTREEWNMDGSRMLSKPKGYTEHIVYADADTHFQEYLKMLEEEHQGMPDQRFIDHPYGIFHGTWRNARWYDEAQRRGLV